MKKLLTLLIVVGILISAGCCDKSEQAKKNSQREYRAKVDYKQAHKQAIKSYKHLTLEELDYAVKITVPCPTALMAAYMHRHAQEYEREMQEIKRLSQLSNEEFIRQVK